MSLGTNIRKRRYELNLSQQDLPFQIVVVHQGRHDLAGDHGEHHRCAGKQGQGDAVGQHDRHGSDQGQDTGKEGGQRLADDCCLLQGQSVRRQMQRTDR